MTIIHSAGPIDLTVLSKQSKQLLLCTGIHLFIYLFIFNLFIVDKFYFTVQSDQFLRVVLFPIPCYIFTMNFNGTYYRLGKHVPQRQNMVRFLQKQRRVSQNIFQFPSLYTNIKLTTAQCTFLRVSISFLILCHCFQKERIV